MAIFSPDKILSTAQAAAVLGVQESTLCVWRCVKRYDLPYIRVGRLIRYRHSDLLQWLVARTEGGGSHADHSK